jgi:hypothetical protein
MKQIMKVVEIDLIENLIKIMPISRYSSDFSKKKFNHKNFLNFVKKQT